MNWSVRKQSDCTILVLEGRLDSSSAPELEQLVTGEGSGWERCILDLQSVSFLSSLGIRVLIKWARAVKSRQARLILAALPEEVHWTLETTGLIPLFTICASSEEALALMNISGEQSSRMTVAGCQLSHYLINEQSPSMLFWSSIQSPGGDGRIPDELLVSLDELGWAVGRGRLTGQGQEKMTPHRSFIADRNALLIASGGNDDEPELVLSRQPVDIHIGVQQAVSWEGQPNHLLRFEEPVNIRAGALNAILLQALQEAAGEDAVAHEALSPETGAVGWLVLAARADSGEDVLPDVLLAGWRQPGSLSEGQSVSDGHDGIILELKHGWNPAPGQGWQAAGKILRQMDSIAALRPLDDSTMVRPVQAWCFVPDKICSGQENRLIIEVTGGQSLPPAWEAIARRIYAGARKVILDPLTGGYSPAKPFRATVEDQQGRRQLPTVFKVGPEELVQREQEAHRQYVEKYILNNSTTIIGAHSYQGARGICYNFLGIGGPDSRLSWMGKVYRERDAEAVIGLLDRLFTSVLKPWYGQPRWKELYLYKDHVGSLGFFPDLYADAEKVSGISADQPELDCPWLGRKLPNPYHFLREAYPVRQQQVMLWYEGICHGDLNLQNILLDEKENLYVIDFSETGPRNIVSDFARLEPIVKFETTRLENEQDLAELLAFEEGLAAVNNLDEKPPFVYSGSDPAVAKAYQVIVRLRQYARQVVIFENDVIPYVLAVLEWTYPVVSYWSASNLGKKLALFSAALMVEQIMRIEALNS